MAFEVKEIQATPNPNALKFILSGTVAERAVSFGQADEASQFPIVKALLSIPGVQNLLFLKDFVTINKRPEVKWPAIRRQARRLLESSEFGDFLRKSNGFTNWDSNRT